MTTGQIISCHLRRGIASKIFTIVSKLNMEALPTFNDSENSNASLVAVSSCHLVSSFEADDKAKQYQTKRLSSKFKFPRGHAREGLGVDNLLSPLRSLSGAQTDVFVEIPSVWEIQMLA
jgi:hypothetical protein